MESQEDKCRTAWEERLANFAPPKTEPSTAKALWAYVHDNFGRVDWLSPETSINPIVRPENKNIKREYNGGYTLVMMAGRETDQLVLKDFIS